jgi:hypothetical protein
VSVLVSVGFSFSFALVREGARSVSQEGRINTDVFASVGYRCAVLRDVQNGLKGRCSTTELRSCTAQTYYTKKIPETFAGGEREWRVLAIQLANTARNCSRQLGNSSLKVRESRSFESTEYAGRRAGVAYSAVVIGITRFAISGWPAVAALNHA